MVNPGPPMPAADREVRQAGPLLDVWQVGQGIGVCLYQRLVPWLDEVARQQGDPGPVQRPRWIGVWRGDQGLPDEQIPRVMVMCRESTGSAEYRSDGEVWGRFDLQVGALVDDSDLGTATRLAAVYGAAIAACVSIHAVEYLEQIGDVQYLNGRTDSIVPTAGLTTQRFEVLAGPLFATSGYLDPSPADPQVPGDDQGDQPVVTDTNLNLAAVGPGSTVGADGS